jgi:toxin ParE1/3/4
MVRRVVWSDQALADLKAVKDYIVRESPSGAETVVRAIEEAADRLVDVPLAARMIPEFGDTDRRETFVYDWRLMYRVEPDHIRMLRVVHGKRLLKNIPGSFEETAQEAYKAA